jgi:glutathione S-transferase
MKVYFAPRSRAVRTVWLIEEIGLPYSLERFELGQKAMREPEYTRVNPNGRVPSLVDGDTTITESTAIAQYLAMKHAPELAPGPGADNFAMYLQWLHYAEGMIMPPFSNYVVETILLPPDRRNPELAARAMKVMARAISAVEPHMAERDYLADEFTIADTITGHAIIMARRAGVDYSALPHLTRYADQLEARPAFKAADSA